MGVLVSGLWSACRWDTSPPRMLLSIPTHRLPGSSLWNVKLWLPLTLSPAGFKSMVLEYSGIFQKQCTGDGLLGSAALPLHAYAHVPLCLSTGPLGTSLGKMHVVQGTEVLQWGRTAPPTPKSPLCTCSWRDEAHASSPGGSGVELSALAMKTTARSANSEFRGNQSFSD